MYKTVLFSVSRCIPHIARLDRNSLVLRYSLLGQWKTKRHLTTSHEFGRKSRTKYFNTKLSLNILLHEDLNININNQISYIQLIISEQKSQNTNKLFKPSTMIGHTHHHPTAAPYSIMYYIHTYIQMGRAIGIYFNTYI